MANKANVLFDKTEIIVQIAAKQAMSLNIKAEDITSITFQPMTEKKLFKKVPSEVILIKNKKFPAFPMVISKMMIEANKKASSWDSVRSQMEKFAANNKITVYHETEEWIPPKFEG